MRKLALGGILALGIFTLASCGGNSDAPTQASKPDASGDNTDVVTPVKRKVVQYCGWDLGTEEEPTIRRMMIEKFNETNKEIRIEMILPQGNYNEYINTLAAAGALPDVFLVENLPDAVINKLALDITPYTLKDSEWKDLDPNLKNTVTFNDKVYGMPSAQHYSGFFANYDVINDYANLGDKTAEEVFAPAKYDVDTFFRVAKEVKDINKTDGSGVIGINATGDMVNWLPSVLDTTGKIKHFVWDGEKFNFTSQIMSDALSKIQELGAKNKKFTFNACSEVDADGVDVRNTIFGSDNENVVFENGQMAFIQGASYYQFDNISANYQFIGYPNKKVISIADYMCESKAAKDKEAAYEVLKYLSYGEQGILDRYKIVDENPTISLPGLPVNTKKSLTDKWFDYVTLPGIKEVYDLVNDGEMTALIEGNKFIPGFINARYLFQTGISIEGVRDGNPLTIGDFLWDVCEGVISINDYKTKMTASLENKINSEITEAYKKIEELGK